LFLVVHDEMESTHHNVVEAEIIAKILEADTNLDADSVAVITPHRAQRNLLNQRLAQFTAGRRPVGVIDTVERLQGGERPNIIVSATESDPASISSRAEFILNLNRSNVAFSRAKNRLIVVVAKSLLDAVPAEIDDYDSTLLWKSLRELCTSVIGTETVNGYTVRIFTPSAEALRREESR
jgi:superfamily I DNA and/or RNA helicase